MAAPAGPLSPATALAVALVARLTPMRRRSLLAQHAGRFKRVAVLDFDLHIGDGTCDLAKTRFNSAHARSREPFYAALGVEAGAVLAQPLWVASVHMDPRESFADGTSPPRH